MVVKTQYLTDHFTLQEMTRSSMGAANHLDNTPNSEQRYNLYCLCEDVLEPLRCHFGMPVVVSSGFRSPEVNKVVKGATKSQHMQGEAADIHGPGWLLLSLDEKIALLVRWAAWIMENCSYDQLILELRSNDAWLHVSSKAVEPNRKQFKTIIKK